VPKRGRTREGKGATDSRVAGKGRKRKLPAQETARRKTGGDAGPARTKGADRPSTMPLPALLRTRGGAFPIVGIGASAGGLDAFQQLFSELPPQTGMAYVVVQHMDPKHGSMLRDILARSTRMPVVEATDATKVKPDQIYVIPPNTSLAILHGTLSLIPRLDGRAPHMPVDLFLRSLAQDQKERAIGVVLSGTASDGALGTRAVKAEGGITFAQAVASAKYTGMPSAAIATGCVDFILPPQGIAAELVRIGRSPYVSPARAGGDQAKEMESEEDLNRIHILLRDATGVDFSWYKTATIRRRVLRRMVLHKIDRMNQYVRYLQEHPSELDVLYRDFLISVTSFFREPETFQTLKTKILPLLLQDRSASTPIRVWVPGCSTGEEAYSIAICLIEALGERANDIPIQIFATDVNEAALDTARTGIYLDSIAQDVSPERIQRFFGAKDRGYQISKYIRDLCIFARQNLANDPPFSRMDLISCRNVLIYMKPALQKRLLPIFHYALKGNGYLMLGTSESIGEFTDLFGVVSRKDKIYAKKAALVTRQMDFRLAVDETEKAAAGRKGDGIAVSPGTVQREAEQILLSRFAPPGVVVNNQMEILQFRGQTGPYLAPAPGPASLNLMKMAREGLAPDLGAMIQKARKAQGTVAKDGIRYRRNGEQKEVRIEVIPIKPVMDREACYLVLFMETASKAQAPGTGGKAGRKGAAGAATARSLAERRIRQLEQEIIATKEYLQSVIEEHESTNEELRSANEEIQSANEELQSTNEELETAKEELQSTNEELTTVNDEMANRNAELALANEEMVNFLESANIPLIIVGADLRIRRFTPNTARVFNLIPADVGRRIQDIQPNIDVSDIDAKIQEVIDSLAVREEEVRDRDGRAYKMRIRPLRTAERRIDGVMVSLIDVQDIRRAKERLKEMEEAFRYAQAIVETVREPLVVLDAELRVKSANRSFYRTFALSPLETQGLSVFAAGRGQWDNPRLRALLEEILPRETELHDFEVEHVFPGFGHRKLLFNARRIMREDGAPQMILLAISEAGPP